jgi:hypothetical protein
LWDSEQGSSVDLAGGREEYRVLSFGPDRDYRVSLLAGTSEYVDRQAEGLVEIPRRCVLDQNAPNPFNPSTRIRFGLPAASRVSLSVFTIRGELVAKLIRGEELAAGYHSRIWDGTDLRGERAASGVYLYRLVTEERTLGRKMVLMQ